MRTGTPSAALARASICGRHCSMWGKIPQCRVNQASALSSHATNSRPETDRSTKRSGRRRRGRQSRRRGSSGNDGLDQGHENRRQRQRGPRHGRCACAAAPSRHGFFVVWAVAATAEINLAQTPADTMGSAPHTDTRIATSCDAARPARRTAASCSASGAATPAELALLPPGLPRRDADRSRWSATLRASGRALRQRAARGAPAGARAAGGARRRAGRGDAGRHAGDDRAGRGHARRSRWRRPLADQDARHGVPRTEAGGDIEFWIVGMGKLGARELNVSSDIDLIYVYEDDGQTDGAAADQRARVLLAGGAQPVRADRRHHRRRLRVPRRPGAAARTATPARRWSAWRCSRSTCRCRAASGSASPG